MTLIPCDACAGTGSESIVVVQDDDTWDEYNANCLVCNGTGAVSDQDD